MKAFFVLVLVTACLLSFISCGPKKDLVNLDHSRYEPDLADELRDYDGKSVYLMNVTSELTDKEWSRYYSPNGQVVYQTNMLKPYFWFMIMRALASAGMTVSDMENPDPDAPAVHFKFKSLNDMDFLFGVDILKNDDKVFSKDFKIKGEPPLERKPPQENAPPPDKNGPPSNPMAEELEKRAFSMVTKTVIAVFTDPGFKKSFLGMSE